MQPLRGCLFFCGILDLFFFEFPHLFITFVTELVLTHFGVDVKRESGAKPELFPQLLIPYSSIQTGITVLLNGKISIEWDKSEDLPNLHTYQMSVKIIL